MRKLSPKQYAQAFFDAYKETPQEHAAALIEQFILMLKKKRDMKKAPRILNALHQLINDRDGKMDVSAVSAHKMAPELHSSLAADLSAALKKDVILAASENPQVIGGVRIQIGDTLIDGTVRTQLEKLQSTF